MSGRDKCIRPSVFFQGFQIWFVALFPVGEGGKGISTPKGAWLSGLWGWIHGVSGRLGFFTTPLETADIMVRENPSCDPQPKCDQMESQEEDETESSGFQGNQQCE